MKSNFPIALLGGHVRQISLRNKGESGVEVFSVTNSEGFTRSTDFFSKEVFSKDVSNYKVVRKGQFAYNPSRINVGSIDYLRIAGKGLVSPLYIVFETDSELYPDYLFRYMKSDWGNTQIRSNTEGAVRDSLKFKGLESIKIPLPPLDDQKRIAHLLGKVEGLIARRKQHLQQLDDLLKSVFLEMFGDPVRNEKGWETGTSSIYADMVTVGVVVKPASYYVEHGVIALRSLNIKPNRIDLNDLVYFSQVASDGPLSKSRLKSGDVVIVRTGKTGTAAVVPNHLEGVNCIDLIIIRPKQNTVNPQYLSFLINSDRGVALIASREVGGIQKHFNIGALNKIPFLLPPIELQNQFAAIVEKVESIKSRYQQSLAELETLYGALSQKAFKGELDLSRVPLPADDAEIIRNEPLKTAKTTYLNEQNRGFDSERQQLLMVAESSEN